MHTIKRTALQLALISPYAFIIFYLIIGFITPGYSHLQHTISRLSLGTYGYLESLNIIQFSVGIILMIYFLRHHIKNSTTIKEISLMLGIIAILLTLLAIFPTDPIDSFPKNILTLSWNGIVHFTLITSFIIFAPIIIRRLYYTFLQDPNYSDVAILTLVCGESTFILSLVWFLFFYLGFLNDYRGLFQKIIALIILYWIIVIMRRTWAITLKKS